MDFKDFCKKLGDAVRPGGTVLIIAHQPPGAGTDDPHEHGSHIAVQDIASVFTNSAWELITAENRTRTVSFQNGKTVTLHDAVVRAQKL